MKKLELPDFLSKKQKADIRRAHSYGRTVLIMGPPGPTGKSTLKNILESQGVKVCESWECQPVVLTEFFQL